MLLAVVPGIVAGVTLPGPSTLAAVAALLTLVVLLAAYLPARRAARLDPADAFRYD